MPARPSWRVIALGVVAVIGGLALAYAAALWFLQGALIYVPQRTTPELAAAAQAQGAQRLRVAVDGRDQVAWLLPAAATAPRVLWIACIGNGGCAARWFEQPDFLLPTLHRASGAAIVRPTAHHISRVEVPTQAEALRPGIRPRLRRREAGWRAG